MYREGIFPKYNEADVVILEARRQCLVGSVE